MIWNRDDRNLFNDSRDLRSASIIMHELNFDFETLDLINLHCFNSWQEHNQEISEVLEPQIVQGKTSSNSKTIQEGQNISIRA
jgi:hypothetical protein